MHRLPQVVTRGCQKARLCEIGELELTGTLLDLALKGGVRLLQLGRHAVELVAERLQLVAGLDRDPLAEIAAADACCAVPQGPYRDHHLAGEQETSQHCNHEGAGEEGTCSR